MNTLLKNVYRAFDFREEEDVYDKLALSVSGDLLTDIYLQNRRSMAIQQAGGAQAKIKEVAVEAASAARIDGDGLTYALDARWTALGSVGHWGHVHQRKNRYEAVVTVAARDGAWKIVGLELRDEQRIDPGAGQPPQDPLHRSNRTEARGRLTADGTLTMIAIDSPDFGYRESEFRLAHPGFLRAARGEARGDRPERVRQDHAAQPGRRHPHARAEGKISVADTEVSALGDARRRDFRIRNIGFVFQDFELLDYLNVLDNILHPYRITRRCGWTGGARAGRGAGRADGHRRQAQAPRERSLPG